MKCERSFDEQALDPGIRGVVRVLRDAGFETTDSGDGYSKQPGPDVLPFPHVAALVTPGLIISEAHRMRDCLGRGWVVEASYSTDDKKAVLLARPAKAEASPRLNLQVGPQIVLPEGSSGTAEASAAGEPLEGPFPDEPEHVAEPLLDLSKFKRRRRPEASAAGERQEEYDPEYDDRDDDDYLPCRICGCLIGDEVGYGEEFGEGPVCETCAGTADDRDLRDVQHEDPVGRTVGMGPRHEGSVGVREDPVQSVGEAEVRRPEAGDRCAECGERAGFWKHHEILCSMPSRDYHEFRPEAGEGEKDDNRRRAVSTRHRAAGAAGTDNSGEATPLTKEQIDALRAEHRQKSREHTAVGYEPLCLECAQVWPCDVIRLADALETERRKTEYLDALRSELTDRWLGQKERAERAESERDRLRTELEAARRERDGAVVVGDDFKRSWLEARREIDRHDPPGRNFTNGQVFEIQRDRDRLATLLGRAGEALPNPERLELIATLFDRAFPDDDDPEVQNDLREWARRARDVLREIDEEMKKAPGT